MFDCNTLQSRTIKHTNVAMQCWSYSCGLDFTQYATEYGNTQLIKLINSIIYYVLKLL